MNPEAEAALRVILSKNPEDLTQQEVAFLNGRRWALNNEQRRVFASVLIQDDGVPTQESPVEPQAPVEQSQPEAPMQPEVPAQPEEPAQVEAAPVVPDMTNEGVTQEPVQQGEPAQSVQSENPYDADPSKFDPDVNQQ